MGDGHSLSPGCWYFVDELTVNIDMARPRNHQVAAV
jgi:hypothetical protein